MTNKLLILGLGMFLLLASTTLAFIPTPFSYYSFENDTLNLTHVNNTAPSQIPLFTNDTRAEISLPGNVSMHENGIIGNAVGFNGTGAGNDATGHLNNLDYNFFPSNYTVSIWFKTIRNDPVDAEYAFFMSNDNSKYAYLGIKNDGSLSTTGCDGGANQIVNFANHADGAWHNVVVTYQGGVNGNCSAYYDGVYFGSNLFGQDTQVSGDVSLMIGYRSDTNKDNTFNGTIDEVGIWDETFTPSQVSELYNGSSAYAWRGGIKYGLDVGLTHAYPMDYGTTFENITTFDYAGNYNGSLYYLSGSNIVRNQKGKSKEDYQFVGTSSKIDFNQSLINTRNYTLSLWFKTTSTQSEYLYSQDNTSGETVLVLLNTGSTIFFGDGEGVTDTNTHTAAYNDGDYHNLIVIRNASGKHTYFDGAILSIDSTTQINILNANSVLAGRDGITNNYVGYLDEVYIWNRDITATERTLLNSDRYYPFVSDTNLSLPNPLDNSAVAEFGNIDINLTYNTTIPLLNCTLEINSSYNQSKFAINGTNILLNYTVPIPPTEINYFTKCFYNDAPYGEYYYYTAITTFTPDFVPPNISSNFTNLSVYLLNNLTGQFNFTDFINVVDYNFSIDGVIVQTSTLGYNFSIINFTQNVTSLGIGSHTLTARISDISSLAIINYTFYKTNISVNYIPNISESVLQTSNITINKTTGLTTVAAATYNGIALTVVKTPFADWDYYTTTFSSANTSTSLQKFDLNWSYTISNPFNSESNTITFPQYVSSVNLSYCTGGLTNVTVNFTILDENNNSPILANGNLLFELIGSAKVFTLNYTSALNFPVCISPSTSSVMSDLSVQYWATGYDVRNFYLVNQEFSNQTQNYTLYLSPQSNNTAIDVKVVNEYDEGLSGYIVQAYKFDQSTNTYTLVQSEITDIDGNSQFYLDVSIDEYRFDVLNPSGTLVYTRPKSKLFLTAYNFRVILGDEPEVVIGDLINLDYTLELATGIKTWTLTWNDADNIIDNITLEVSRTNATAKEIFSTQTSSNAAGVFTYTLLTSDEGVYDGTVSVYSSADDRIYPLETKSLTINLAWDVFGTETLIMALMFIGTLVMAGFAYSAEAGLMGMALGFFVFTVLGFIRLSAPALIGLIVVIIILSSYLYKRFK